MLTINYNDGRAGRGKARYILGAIARFAMFRPVIYNLNINVTNLCNQKCPMCNARLDVKDAEFMTAAQLKKYLTCLRPYLPATATLSGGEPTLAPELPQIIEVVKEAFPYGVGLSSNLYGTNDLVRNNLLAALKAGIRISCSFDGFGEVAEKQRGVRKAAENVIENVKFVTQMGKELSSKSALIIHTVISDLNIDQLPEIFEFSQQYGWSQRVATTQCLYYHGVEKQFSTLHYNDKLKDMIEVIKKAPNLKQSHEFIDGMLDYTKGSFKKYCPYITSGTRFMKVFLDPNGDISLCDREAIGNLNKEAFGRIVKGAAYKEKLRKYKACKGCWTPCFVEPMLQAKKFLPWV